MLRWLAEKRIQDAIDRGELETYEGKGQPFPEEFFAENPYVPENLRQSFKFLKGASFTPHVLLLKHELDVLRIRAKSKKLTAEDRRELEREISTKAIEYEVRMEFYRSSLGG